MRGCVYLSSCSAIASQGRLDEAIDLLERARKLKPGLRTIDLMLAEIRRRKAVSEKGSGILRIIACLFSRDIRSSYPPLRSS